MRNFNDCALLTSIDRAVTLCKVLKPISDRGRINPCEPSRWLSWPESFFRWPQTPSQQPSAPRSFSRCWAARGPFLFLPRQSPRFPAPSAVAAALTRGHPHPCSQRASRPFLHWGEQPSSPGGLGGNGNRSRDSGRIAPMARGPDPGVPARAGIRGRVADMPLMMLAR